MNAPTPAERATWVRFSKRVVIGIEAVLARSRPLSMEDLCALGELAWEPTPPDARSRERQRAARADALDRVFEESSWGNVFAAMVVYGMLAAEGMDEQVAELERRWSAA